MKFNVDGRSSGQMAQHGPFRRTVGHFLHHGATVDVATEIVKQRVGKRISNNNNHIKSWLGIGVQSLTWSTVVMDIEPRVPTSAE